MSDQSWLIERLFPFDAATPDLDGSVEARGAVGFGDVPRDLCLPRIGDPPVTNRSMGWNPVLKSLAYVSLNTSATPRVPVQPPGPAHDVTMMFVGKSVQEGDLKGTTGGVAGGTYWQQVFFHEVGIQVAYFANLTVPIREGSGQPFGLRVLTQNRTGPSMLLGEFQWARAVRDTSAEQSTRLADHVVDRLLAALERLREAPG